MARAAAANCHSLYGAACANRLHGIGGRGSGLRERHRGRSIPSANEFPFSGRKNTMAGVHDFTAKSLAGEDIPLKRFEGQVLLIVNSASACGFHPQYKGLEALHQALS